MRPILLPLLFLPFSAPLFGSSSNIAPIAARIQIPRVSRPPQLEDFLTDVAREAEATVTDFRQYDPGDGVPVTQLTTAYLSYDDRSLYVAFVCKDDPAQIRARLSKRDTCLSDDRVTINIDTFHDHHRAYWFDVNAYGVQADGNVTDGVEDNADWDTVWRSEARLTKDGYVVLAEIPFKSLRFPNADAQTWGILLGRAITRNNELSVWPNVSHTRTGWVQQFGDLEGLSRISPGRNFQVIPYGLFSRARNFDDAAPADSPYRTDSDARAGIDAKIVIRDSFTLDFTVNPDFSQVESDEPQVTVNQRYEVYFPEKRPFFLENAGMFRTPQTLFFSRRIADPQFGARLTGKAGGWALGVLATDDRAPGERLDGGDPYHDDRAVNGVFRLQREFSRTSRLGFLMTTQDFGAGFNRVYSLDTSFNVSRNWIVDGQAMDSRTRQLDGAELAGAGYFAQLRHEGRHLHFHTAYTDLSPDFRANLGFFSRVDIRQHDYCAGYNWRPETGTVKSYGPGVWGSFNWRRDGRLQDWSVTPRFVSSMSRQSYLEFYHTEAYELFQDIGFRRRMSEFYAGSAWTKWLSVNLQLAKGRRINYYPTPGLLPFLGDSIRGSVGLTLRPTAQLRWEQSYIYNRLGIGGGSEVATAQEGAAIFNNHLFRSKLNYQFTRELSLRAILDYNSVLPNASLVSLEPSKLLRGDLLLTYMLNPGTALHIGYTDAYENLALDPTVSPEWRRSGFPDTSTGRQIFVKLSYLLRM
jgi:hypothetical protein